MQSGTVMAEFAVRSCITHSTNAVWKNLGWRGGRDHMKGFVRSVELCYLLETALASPSPDMLSDARNVKVVRLLFSALLAALCHSSEQPTG